MALFHLRTFFELRRRNGESWHSFTQRFYLAYADAAAAGLQLSVFGQSFLLSFWGFLSPDSLRDCLSQFHGRRPRSEHQIQALMAHLKRQSSWNGQLGPAGKGIFMNSESMEST